MEEKKININFRPEATTGNYSNLAIISHTHSEFVIDFASMLPGQGRPEVHSRIIMAPEHAKRLLHALTENVSRYEMQYGAIELNNKQAGATINLADFNTNGTKS